jgi:hypothetical protein
MQLVKCLWRSTVQNIAHLHSPYMGLEVLNEDWISDLYVALPCVD